MSTLDFIYYFYFFGLGALFGSFANVVIYRLPQGKSVVMPRSRCGSCDKLIPWYYNIPIFTWLILGGRCSQCKAKFSIRYLVVELLTASLFLAIFYRFSWSFSTLEFLILAFGLVVITFIDLDHMIIPDVFSVSGIALGLVGALLNPERVFLDSILGAVIGGGSLLLLSVLYYAVRKEEGLGGGDIKLLAWLGSYLGVMSLPFIVMFSSFLGMFVSVFVMIYYKKSFKTAIPFGPFLAGAALGYLFWGDIWYQYIFSTLQVVP